MYTLYVDDVVDGARMTQCVTRMHWLLLASIISRWRMSRVSPRRLAIRREREEDLIPCPPRAENTCVSDVRDLETESFVVIIIIVVVLFLKSGHFFCITRIVCEISTCVVVALLHNCRKIPTLVPRSEDVAATRKFPFEIYSTGC